MKYIQKGYGSLTQKHPQPHTLNSPEPVLQLNPSPLSSSIVEVTQQPYSTGFFENYLFVLDLKVYHKFCEGWVKNSEITIVELLKKLENSTGSC